MRERSTDTTAAAWVGAITLIVFAYAILRYVAWGPVPAREIPLYVLNKAVGFTALTLFSLTPWLALRGAATRAQAFGRFGTWLAFGHVLLALLVFSVGGYRALFDASGVLPVRIQLALLAGVASVVLLAWHHRHVGHPFARWARRLVVAGGLLHVTVMGAPGWLTPAQWHGGLPPITLIAALIATTGLLGMAVRVNPRPAPE